MTKPIFGLILGGILGVFDGLTAYFTPEVRNQLLGIVLGSTFKGLIAGLSIGYFSKKVDNLGLGIVFGAASAIAQGSVGAFSGVVHDSSGAVLPGVTVEASSDALIEKVRSVVSDGQGQYKIIDLRPGTYVLTFSLPGFSTVRREGLALTSGTTVPYNAEMKVGALEETLTVRGETPVVDVQSTRNRQVMGREVLDSVPRSRDAATAGRRSGSGARYRRIRRRDGLQLQPPDARRRSDGRRRRLVDHSPAPNHR